MRAAHLNADQLSQTLEATNRVRQLYLYLRDGKRILEDCQPMTAIVAILPPAHLNWHFKSAIKIQDNSLFSNKEEDLWYRKSSTICNRQML